MKTPSGASLIARPEPEPTFYVDESIFSNALVAELTAAGIAFNPAFAGAYDFTASPDFGELMRLFIADMPDGGLVMCHPGFVDDTLRSLDPLTTQREAEHAWLAGDHFPPLLAANNVTLG